MVSQSCDTFKHHKQVQSYALQDIYAETSNADSRSNALSYTKLMESSCFIVSLVSAQHVLSVPQPLSKALQITECDIVKAYRDADIQY